VSACAGVQLPKEKLGDSPGALMFNGYTKAEVGCYACHNGDAAGTMRGPGLADHVRDDSDSQLAEVIKNGNGRMPAHKDRLTDDEVGQLVGWLRATFPTPVKP
jgi:mono/diheme cytochrome c family protein